MRKERGRCLCACDIKSHGDRRQGIWEVQLQRPTRSPSLRAVTGTLKPVRLSPCNIETDTEQRLQEIYSLS